MFVSARHARRIAAEINIMGNSPNRPMSDNVISGPANRARRRAESNDGKQPLPLLLAIDVVGKRPELRDDHYIEDTNPEEERDAKGSCRHTTLPSVKNSSRFATKKSVT